VNGLEEMGYVLPKHGGNIEHPTPNIEWEISRVLTNAATDLFTTCTTISAGFTKRCVSPRQSKQALPTMFGAWKILPVSCLDSACHQVQFLEHEIKTTG
jgi:hypothetical protein